MDSAQYIPIAGVLATILGSIITWLVMKRQFASKKLSYVYSIESIMKGSDPDLALDLKVFYKDEELPEPTLLSVDVTNTGLTAIENAEIVIQLPGATYLIPGYFVDIPAGYLFLWDIERTDAEECTLKLKHINPRQTARVRLLMDEMPKGEPRIVCPMPNVECTRARSARVGAFAEFVVSAVAPELLGSAKFR